MLFCLGTFLGNYYSSSSVYSMPGHFKWKEFMKDYYHCYNLPEKKVIIFFLLLFFLSLVKLLFSFSGKKMNEQYLKCGFPLMLEKHIHCIDIFCLSLDQYNGTIIHISQNSFYSCCLLNTKDVT